MTVNEKTILTEAAQLVRTGWTCGTYARDRDGEACNVTDEEACEFCLLGAIDRAAFTLEQDFERASGLYHACVTLALAELRERTGSDRANLDTWNDTEAESAEDVAVLLEAAAAKGGAP